MEHEGCNFGWDADAIAENLGTVILTSLGFGEDGSVFLLEDGRVMKLTSSEDEAALCAHLAIAGVGDLPLPRVHGVSLHLASGEEWSDCWVIVREDVRDMWHRDTPEGRWLKAEAWDEVHSAFCEVASRSTGASDILRDAASFVGEWDCHGGEMRDALAGFSRVREHLQVELRDWKCDNLGCANGGRVVMRDLSRCRVPEWMLDAFRYDMSVTCGATAGIAFA